MAVKLLDVEGERIPESDERASQDWVLEAGKTAFLNANASRFLLNLRAGVSNAPKIPEAVKSAVSSVARVASAALETVGVESKTLAFFGHPPLHPIAENYFSQVPMRWGSYVAKIGFYPTQATIDSLSEIKIEDREDFNAFRHAIVDHFASAGAEFELRVQLALDSNEMPVEDASIEWPEAKSPYRRVARLVLPAQAAWTHAREDYFDQRLRFQPAHSCAAHRPLGQVMRARLFVYARLAEFRQGSNGVSPIEPLTLADVPD